MKVQVYPSNPYGTVDTQTKDKIVNAGPSGGRPIKVEPKSSKDDWPFGDVPEAEEQLRVRGPEQQQDQVWGNQMWAQGKEVSPSTVVKSWVTEEKHYNHSTNSCVANQQCGVYTQVVWRKSEELGCAQANCAKNVTSLTICFYNPPGNIVGEKPY
ncbi:STS14 protein [Bienertia sinuspersici]